MSISVKVALSIAIVTVVVGVAALAYVLEAVGREQQKDFRSTTIEALQLLGLSIAPAMVAGRHDRVQAVLDNIANYPERFPDIEALEVVHRDGRVMADLDPRRFNMRHEPAAIARDLAATRPVAREVEGQALDVVVPVRLAHPIGVIRARVSEERFAAALAQRRREAALAVVGASVLMAVALWIVLRRLIGTRLERLAGKAAQLGAGDMSVRAEIEGTDEIAQLAKAFNQMAEDLGAYTSRLESLVRERTSELEDANLELARIAVTDALTGLWNRRHFEERAARDLEIARRAHRPFALVVIDVDHFKSVNDRFGHPIGDRVLQTVAATLTEQARSADLVARIGGEEFAVAMPDTATDAAAHAAERMRVALESMTIPDVPELAAEVITASFGVAAFPEHGGTIRALVAAADEALYGAKRGGRNRVEKAGGATQTNEEADA